MTSEAEIPESSPGQALRLRLRMTGLDGSTPGNPQDLDSAGNATALRQTNPIRVPIGRGARSRLCQTKRAPR